jgi:DNA-binding CsgD family transcriptional regulator
MNLEAEVAYRRSSTGALAAGTLRKAGVSVEVPGMRAQSSPRITQFLNGLPHETRRRLLDGLRQRLTKEGSPVVLLKANDEQPLIAHLASRSGGVGDDRAVLLTDLHDFQVPHENILRAVFDLTPAEVPLAQAMTRGDTLEEVATSLGIKMSTARTQLAAIFAKTGTQRQAKLVAILTRLALLVG